jgi:GT2 family glycosyltransferase
MTSLRSAGNSCAYSKGECARITEKMKVSVIIPCYNEKNTIEKIIEAVRTAPVQNKEIIGDSSFRRRSASRLPMEEQSEGSRR